MTPTHGAEHEKGWQWCDRCGIRSPVKSLKGIKPDRETVDWVCRDEVWCDKRKRGLV